MTYVFTYQCPSANPVICSLGRHNTGSMQVKHLVVILKDSNKIENFKRYLILFSSQAKRYLTLPISKVANEAVEEGGE